MTDILCEDTACECAALLEQAADLVLAVKGRTYRQDGPGPIGGLGEQVRHLTEFYQAFFAGLAQGRVDYDARPRDARVEADPAFAGEVLAELGTQLRETPWSDTPIDVRMDDAGACFTRSSVARELRFLASHTVHHFAIIRLLLGGDEARMPARFGVAPATVRHRVACDEEAAD